MRQRFCLFLLDRHAVGGIRLWASWASFTFTHSSHQYWWNRLLFWFLLWSNLLKVCKMTKTYGRLAINLSSMLNLPPVSTGWWGSERLDEPLPLSSGGAAEEEIQRTQCSCMKIMAFMAVKCFKILRFCLENQHAWATATNNNYSSNITFNTTAAIQNHLYMSLCLSPWF